MEYVLGHGTENDFVLLPDLEGRLDLEPAAVRALCHRRRGLGADGVLRVAPSPDPGAAWFMDYRNADGSLAEMCGNGIRVFARFLVEAGLAPAGTSAIATRAGLRVVELGDDPDGEVSVDMGPARLGSDSAALVPSSVGPAGFVTSFPGVAVDVGNPHLACVTTADLDALDLTVAPGHDVELFPDGVNVEFLTPLTPDGVTRLRVHERGSGETRSCGTGTVAGAVAALRAVDLDSGTVTVATPGGVLQVGVGPGLGSAPGSTTTLTGPAVLVARGEVDLAADPAAPGELRALVRLRDTAGV
ncbi:diaminopimelate epimerase [Actinomycetospora endophytica]|uniref:Diaminopimelate epimerase n=1 Tax=Actinomycetospora endophytica TaxID=2291215 RepID=A0ABS8PG83_9PSEU|nr:diaminopimelate epimerase [Actinomycetospora endophytica]MCD2197262.1 diaminopimelate epimerase [Actinomycetospora endophytica]